MWLIDWHFGTPMAAFAKLLQVEHLRSGYFAPGQRHPLADERTLGLIIANPAKTRPVRRGYEEPQQLELLLSDEDAREILRCILSWRDYRDLVTTEQDGAWVEGVNYEAQRRERIQRCLDFIDQTIGHPTPRGAAPPPRTTSKRRAP